VLDDEAARRAPAETEAYLRAVAAAYADRVDRWLGEAPLMTGAWQMGARLSDVRLRLTPAEAKELHDAVFALAARYRRDDDPGEAAPDDAERVAFQFQIMPFLRSTEVSIEDATQ
jgi:hypothetical protein